MEEEKKEIKIAENIEDTENVENTKNMENVENMDNLPEKEKEIEIEDNKKISFWLIICSVFAALSIILFFLAYKIVLSGQEEISNSIESFSAQETEGEKKDLVSRYIDGVYVESGGENIYPLAIMIDNHTDARPAFALSKANLVFEAEAEGGITRYLAVFATSEKLDKIGPIRSARPYFVDWASEFSALYTHVGGSPEALAKMTKEDIFHINEFYQGEYFWRGEDKEMPHNVYTSTENLYSYLEKKEKSEGAFFSWLYKDDESLENRGEESSIKIDFLLDKYKVEWKYSKDENSYTRYLAGIEHADADGSIVTAKNILIAYIPAEVVDDAMRLKMDVVGSGKAVICLDGFCKEGEWEKKNKTSRTRFYINDEEAELNRGTTWVEVVRPEREITY